MVAPPPSRASKITIEPLVVLPPVEEARTPTPAQTPTEQRNKIVIDFLRRAKHGLDKGICTINQNINMLYLRIILVERYKPFH